MSKRLCNECAWCKEGLYPYDDPYYLCTNSEAQAYNQHLDTDYSTECHHFDEKGPELDEQFFLDNGREPLDGDRFNVGEKTYRRDHGVWANVISQEVDELFIAEQDTLSRLKEHVIELEEENIELTEKLGSNIGDLDRLFVDLKTMLGMDKEYAKNHTPLEQMGAIKAHVKALYAHEAEHLTLRTTIRAFLMASGLSISKYENDFRDHNYERMTEDFRKQVETWEARNRGAQYANLELEKARKDNKKLKALCKHSYDQLTQRCFDAEGLVYELRTSIESILGRPPGGEDNKQLIERLRNYVSERDDVVNDKLNEVRVLQEENDRTQEKLNEWVDGMIQFRSQICKRTGLIEEDMSGIEDTAHTILQYIDHLKARLMKFSVDKDLITFKNSGDVPLFVEPQDYIDELKNLQEELANVKRVEGELRGMVSEYYNEIKMLRRRPDESEYNRELNKSLDYLEDKYKEVTKENVELLCKIEELEQEKEDLENSTDTVGVLSDKERIRRHITNLGKKLKSPSGNWDTVGAVCSGVLKRLDDMLGVLDES